MNGSCSTLISCYEKRMLITGTSLPLKKARSCIGAERGSSLMRPLLTLAPVNCWPRSILICEVDAVNTVKMNEFATNDCQNTDGSTWTPMLVLRCALLYFRDGERQVAQSNRKSVAFSQITVDTCMRNQHSTTRPKTMQHQHMQSREKSIWIQMMDKVGGEVSLKHSNLPVDVSSPEKWQARERNDEDDGRGRELHVPPA